MKYKRLFWTSLLSLTFLACGGAKKTATSPTDNLDDSASGEQESSKALGTETATDDHSDDTPPDEPKSELGDDLPPPVPENWQPNERDCEDLADQFEFVLRKKELAKLEKRHLSDKQREKSLPNLERTVKAGRANWMKACEQIIGTTQFKKRWTCASKAKTMDRFNGCMDGKFDSELPDE